MGNCIIARNGGGMDTYSTEEQIVGTWVDGKTIYRKYIELASGKTVYSLSSNNIETVVKLEMYEKESSGNIIPLNFYNGSDTFTFCLYNKTSKCIEIVTTRSLAHYGIIEYTKTTD